MSIAAPLQNEYDTDFCKWLYHQCKFLKKHEFDKLDIDNLIEEIDGLRKSDRRALKSHLTVILTHMLKKEFVPEQQGNSKSWDSSIFNSHRCIKMIIEDSPSLKKDLIASLSIAYDYAKDQASAETYLELCKFPKECPWTIKELFPELEKKY